MNYWISFNPFNKIFPIISYPRVFTMELCLF
nr:MAG TPA: hypothetical protein [Caudoviricetes sp.]